MTKANRFPLAYAVLSRIQASGLLQARESGRDRAVTSLDLGLSQQEVRLDPAGVHADGRRLLDWQQLQAIAESENGCFRVHDNAIR